MSMWTSEDQARIERAARENADRIAQAAQAGAAFAEAVLAGTNRDTSAADALGTEMNTHIQREQNPADPAEAFTAWLAPRLEADAGGSAFQLARLGVHASNLTTQTDTPNA